MNYFRRFAQAETLFASITTTFNNNAWVTTVPIKGADQVFLTGLAFPVTSSLPGGGISPTWSGIFSASAPGRSVQWRWGAAVYTCLPPAPGVYNLLNVKPTPKSDCNIVKDDKPAGTPQAPAFQQLLPAEPRAMAVRTLQEK